jgi:hypothetical protein
MSWVFNRPLLTALEVGWRWIFGILFLAVCWMQTQKILAVLPIESSGLTEIDAQNPWVAAVQLAHVWSLYQPQAMGILRWLAPLAALAWVIISGVGRSLVLNRMIRQSELRPRGFRIFAMIVLQAAFLLALAAIFLAWFRTMEWVAATHIPLVGEPDLVGYACWAIFLSLGFYTMWALISWPLSIAPLLVLLEGLSLVSVLVKCLKLGKAFTGKLVEINLVMGIVKLALIVLAMVFSAAPLPFSDELGSDALHCITALAAIFYFVVNDYFQVVRLKGFLEFWKMFRAPQSAGR